MVGTVVGVEPDDLARLTLIVTRVSTVGALRPPRRGGLMPSPSPGYSITLRVQTPTAPSVAADLATAVATAGGAVTALDIVESHFDRLVVDVTCNASDAEHA